MAKAESLGKKLLLPVDAVTIADFPNPIDAPVEIEVYDADKMPADREGCDIGPKTQALLLTQLRQQRQLSGTDLWVYLRTLLLQQVQLQ